MGAARFFLLGPLEARVDGHLVDVGHVRRQCVLAALLVDANRTVPVDELIYRVWGDQALPARPAGVLQTYVSLIRRILRDTPDTTITRQSAGYRLTIAPAAVDLYRFDELHGRARMAAEGGDDESAAVLLDEALRLWRGVPFASFGTEWFDIVRTKLDNQRRAAELDFTDVRLRRGRHAELLGELSGRSAERPLDERIAGQLMLALYRSGRQADSLEHYQRTRLRLADELGTDVSGPLRDLHQRILTADPALTHTAAVPHRPARQLPADIAGFSGRAEHLDRLDAMLAGPAPVAVAVSAVSGTAGVGKTALALHWAHRVADRFPDGQLYVNLRGFHPTEPPMDPAEAIRRFLHALDVPPDRIPSDVDAQAALYRSELAGRRLLIVLDDARDPAQIRPLLPGTPGCLVLLTSRNPLSGLVARDGVQPVLLDVLTVEEATELLARRLGAERTSAEPGAVLEIVERCARLPLALAIAAARAGTHPRLPLRALADQLRDTSLASLSCAGDPVSDLRTVFSGSYRALTPPAARLFRLLGLHPGVDIGAPAAAALAGLPPPAALSSLDELVQANLIAEPVHGRYTLHDLLRAYAADLAESPDSPEDRRAAVLRVLDHYLHTAHAADRLLDPVADPITLEAPRPGCAAHPLADRHQALAWFTAEYPVLLAAIAHAADAGCDAHAARLAWTFWTFLDRQGLWQDQATIARLAVAAAERLSDPDEQARAHRLFAHANTRLGRHTEAAGALRHALDLYRHNENPAGQAHTHFALGYLAGQRDDPARALDHARQALELYRSTGDEAGEAHAHNQVGWYHAALGNHRRALPHCDRALALHRSLGDRVGQAGTWDSLGHIHQHLGDGTQAVASYRQALALHRALGNRYYEAATLTNLGDTHHQHGDLAAAAEAWRQALAIHEALDQRDATDLRASSPPAEPIKRPGPDCA